MSRVLLMAARAWLLLSLVGHAASAEEKSIGVPKAAKVAVVDLRKIVQGTKLATAREQWLYEQADVFGKTMFATTAQIQQCEARLLVATPHSGEFIACELELCEARAKQFAAQDTIDLAERDYHASLYRDAIAAVRAVACEKDLDLVLNNRQLPAAIPASLLQVRELDGGQRNVVHCVKFVDITAEVVTRIDRFADENTTNFKIPPARALLAE